MKRKIIVFIFVFVLVSSFIYANSDKNAVIYFDISGSMIPYIQENSAYTEIISNLRGKILINAGFGSYSIANIGDTVSTPQIDKINKIQSYTQAKTYNKWTTNLINGVSNLNKRINKGEYNVGLLITDAVLCINKGSGYDLREMKKILRKSIYDYNLALCVIGIKSNFNGNIYPVTEGVEPYPWQGERPFYIFLFSKNNNADELKTLKEGIISFCYYENFNYDSVLLSPITKYRYTFDMNLPQIIYQKDSYKNIFLFESKDINKVRYLLAKRIKPGKEASLSIPIRSVPETNEHRDLYGFDLTAEFSNNINSNQVKVSQEDNKINLTLNYSFTRDFKNCSKQIELIIRPEIDVIHPNYRIWGNWSTDDDSVKENSDKTMNISPLLSYIYNQSILRAINEVNTMSNATSVLKLIFYEL